MTKRARITLIVIVGLALTLAAVVFFSLRELSIEARPPLSSTPLPHTHAFESRQSAEKAESKTHSVPHQRNWIEPPRTSVGATATTHYSQLPPTNLPVVEVLRQLRPAADAGNPVASCRLGIELARCWRADLVSSSTTLADSVRQSEGALQFATDERLCEGISAADRGSAWRYLLAAAQSGNVAAMTKFALDPPLSTSTFVEDLEGWQALKQYGGQFLLSSIEAGDPYALYRAFFSAATGLGPGGATLLPQDATLSVIYGRVLVSILPPSEASRISVSLEQIESKLSATQLASASVQADALRKRAFARQLLQAFSDDHGYVDPTRCELN
jgi:hypothetical protein